jgi:hypothetical protein
LWEDVGIVTTSTRQTGVTDMTKDEILTELLFVAKQIATYKRGEGNLTALKAYHRKLYAEYRK